MQFYLEKNDKCFANTQTLSCQMNLFQFSVFFGLQQHERNDRKIVYQIDPITIHEIKENVLKTIHASLE